MPVLSVTHPTLLDFRDRLDPNDKVATLIELLDQTNEMTGDAVYLEGNELTGHTNHVRTGLPTATWYKLYGGIQPTTSKSKQVTDTCGMVGAYAEVSKKLADLNGNTMAWRLSEDMAHIQSITQTVEQTAWYGNEGTEPAKFTGLSPRYNSRSAPNGENIIDAGGDSGSLTSMWLIGWGSKTCHMFYPKGSKAGLDIQDKGQVTIENIDGQQGRMEGYRTFYSQDVGLALPDWQYVVRIANIDTLTLTKNASGGADLIDLMTQACELPPPTRGIAKWSFYCGRTIRSFLRRQIVNKVAQSTLSMDAVGGRKVMTFDDIPIRRSDQLIIGESRVV